MGKQTTGGKSAMGKRVPVLMYHKVSPNRTKGRNEKLRVTPDKFDRQMEYLVDHGYKTVTVDELINFCSGNLPLPGRRVIISFDDGYRDNFLHAFPILQKYNFKAVIFLVSGYIGKSSEWDEKGNEPLLTWEEVKEMRSAGICFGSHGHKHRLLPSLSPEDIKEEIISSKSIIENKLGCPVDFFSYPWGKLNEDVKAVVKESGYKGAFSTHHGKNGHGEDIFSLRRVIIRGYDTRLHFFLNLACGRSRI